MGQPIAVTGRRVVGTLALQLMALIALQSSPAQAAGPDTAPPAAASASPPDAAKMEEARRHFERGLILLRDPEGEKVEPAFFEFKSAYELSKSPRVLGNIGYCAMRMERNTESVTAYREYIRLVPDIDPAERAQITRDLVTMSEGAATVTVRYTGPGVWTLVDERTPAQGSIITNAYTGRENETLTLLVHPGRHELHAKVNGEEQGRWEVEANAGGSITHTFEPKPKAPIASAPTPVIVARPPDASASRTPQIVVMSVGGALLLTSAITGIAAYSKMRDVDRQCPNNICPTSVHGEIDSARTLGTATDALLISGVVVAAGGAIWFALSPSHRETGAPSVSGVSGACVPGGCGLSMRGSF